MTGPVRCPWCGDDPLYVSYHDNEWGVPMMEDRGLFEFLVLEGVQAGLSWITVLRKRDGYRSAFDGFDPCVVARYDSTKVESLMENPSIVRNRRKIVSAVENARAFLNVREERGSFASYLWGFVDGIPIVNRWERCEDIPSETDLSRAVSKDMKRRGFSFVGPVTIYAMLQAAGLVNDHLLSCYRHPSNLG